MTRAISAGGNVGVPRGREFTRLRDYLFSFLRTIQLQERKRFESLSADNNIIMMTTRAVLAPTMSRPSRRRFGSVY